MVILTRSVADRQMGSFFLKTVLKVDELGHYWLLNTFQPFLQDLDGTLAVS